MRLHRLQVSAFGPFAGTEQVDFDELGEAGLFLLHGQTGAGKSSILDAVCYALYGRLPGARGSARPHLRSDHARDTDRPEVRLELTLDNRRFEITRSPEWQRPKRRGAGTTSEKGTVILREHAGGRWETVTTRADEAGHLLHDLLGMRLDQFTKVVLLPQGEFAAFLRSDAEARRGLLQQLFSTSRFADIETWLSERRRDLGREVAAVRTRTELLLARADEHAAQLAGAAEITARAAGPDPAQAAAAAASQEVSGHVPVATPAEQLRALAERAAQIAADAAQEAEATTAAAESARTALEAGRDLAARRLQIATLTDRASALLEAEPEQERRRARVDRARRAAPLAPRLEASARLLTELERAESAWAEAVSAVPAELSGVGRLALESARTELGKELGRLSAARDVRAAQTEQQNIQAEAEGLAAGCTRSAEVAKEQSTRAAERKAAVLARLDHTKLEAARRPAAESRLRDLDRIQRALGAKRSLEREVETAQASARERQAVALELKEHWLALRERRLAGMAAELSARLVDGAPCPVCGAAEHPAPAPPNALSVTTEAERVAQEDSFSAEQAWVSAREHLASLTSGLADAVERAGDHTVKQIKAAIADAKADLAVTVDAGDRLDSHQDDLLALEGQLVEFAQLSEEMLTQAAAQTARGKAAATQVRRLTTQLDRLRGADVDIDTRELRISAELAAVGHLLDCLDERARAVKASARAIADGEKAYRAAGFIDIAEAGQAVLAPDELTALAAEVAAHDEQVATVRDQLEDAALLAALDVDAPDLPALTAADSAAANRRRQAEQQHARVESARVGLSRLAGELDEHLSQSRALLADSALVDDLARCVEGTGGDNVLRMRLSSYVLAARLEEVAAAATERLLVMSDGRYSLVHSDALAKGGVRSGLGLQVVDGWTGVERDTATLSGGESFLASLALALGLADAVQAEAGGAVMQTLFIDEGFGMLDEETLDEVMTVLDSLREGGRSVGLVSHVADLRDRIPAQLEVRKSRTGSRIVVPDAGAA